MKKPRSKKARRFACLATSMSLCAAALGASREVHAEPYVVASPEVLLASPVDVAYGVGGAATLGWGLDLEPLLVAPELSLSGHALRVTGVPPGRPNPAAPPQPESGDIPPTSQSLLRALVGVRVGVTAAVEPSVFVRAGVGMTDSDRRAAPGVAYGEVVNPSASGGVALDAGAALDVRLSRDLTVGFQLGYAGLAAVGGETGSLHAFDAGARVGVWF